MVNKLIDITKGEEGIQLRTPLGPGAKIRYHGQNLDPRALPFDTAKAMLEDAKCRYVIAVPPSAPATTGKASDKA